MKRNFKLVGLAMFMSVAALTFTACGGDNTEATTEEVIEVEVIEEDAAGDVEVIEEVIEVDTAATEGKCGEGKCGEGKCGDDSAENN